MQKIIRGGLILQRNTLFIVQKSRIIRQQHFKAAATTAAAATEVISTPIKGTDNDLILYISSF